MSVPDLRPLWVDRAMYAIPRRARTVHPEGENLALVLHEGTVTILTSAGEIEVPDRLQPALRERYFTTPAHRLTG